MQKLRIQIHKSLKRNCNTIGEYVEQINHHYTLSKEGELGIFLIILPKEQGATTQTNSPCYNSENFAEELVDGL